MEKFKSVPLEDRVKIQERKYQSYIYSKDNMIIRLDGDGFSKFTKGFRKPFDSIITKTMINVTEELFKRFSCSFAYTQSDEITLIIPSNNGFIFGGKIQKIVSLSAGQASTLFNKYLIENIEKEKDLISKELYNSLIKKINVACFDSMVFGFEDREEVFNTVLWRMRDAERNSISMLAYSEFSHKSLQNKNSEDKRKMLLEKGIDWELLEDGLKYGFYFKKMVFEKTPNVLRMNYYIQILN